MSNRGRDPEAADKDKSDRKERKHKHRDRDREGKSRHRTTEVPAEEKGDSHLRKDTNRVRAYICLQCLVDSGKAMAGSTPTQGRYTKHTQRPVLVLQDLERHASRHSESRDNRQRDRADERAASPR